MFTEIHFVVAREQSNVMSPHKLNQSKYFRLCAKGPFSHPMLKYTEYCTKYGIN